jgi:hypothetical protein
MRAGKGRLFALYFASRCHDRLGNMAAGAGWLPGFNATLDTAFFWKWYADRSDLPC